MSQSHAPRAIARTHYEQLTDVEGRPVLIPLPTVEHFRRRGLASITLTVGLQPAQPPREWLTLTEAARLHVSDVDGLTFNQARMRVSRALSAGKFTAEGRGTRRRINPETFDAWRLQQREHNLSKEG